MEKNYIKYIYLHESDISEEEYLSFLRKYYKERAEYRLYKRYSWYKEYLGFHCLLAVLNGEIVGQSCASRVRMMTPEGEKEWWWSCDTFVLTSARGYGVGKGLQKKLHEDHPNFSSAGYSLTNGHIKRLMGAKGIAKTYPCIYPVRRYMTFWLQAVYRKLTGKYLSGNNIPRIPLGLWLNHHDLSRYVIDEKRINKENIHFINDVLQKNYKSYVIRDEEYLRWKLERNPSVEYYLLEVREHDELIAVVIFSIAYDGEYFSIPIRMSKVYDIFIKKGSSFTYEKSIVLISRFFSRKGERIDAISGIFKTKYKLAIYSPNEGCDLLSIYDGDFSSPYISMSDHDLEQILALEK